MLALLCSVACHPSKPDQKSETKGPSSRPNIIFFVADDLGFIDIGPFGGDILTPVRDKLSKESMLFSEFHVLPTCSPIRSLLLTGQDNYIAGLGVVGEASYPSLKELPGYSGHLADLVLTLPEIIHEHGYHT